MKFAQARLKNEDAVLAQKSTVLPNHFQLSEHQLTDRSLCNINSTTQNKAQTLAPSRRCNSSLKHPTKYSVVQESILQTLYSSVPHSIYQG